MHKKQAIIQALFKAEAIQLNFKNYFTWTSGIKSPIYCDTRLLTGDVRAREKVVDAFIESINKNYPGTKLIAGVASSGISWAAMIAQKMRLPMVYVRGAAKGYGAGRQIEGIYQPQQKVVVIEDLISTGSSCLNTVTVLQAAGLEVLGVQSIMTYGLEKAKHNFENHATILNSLVSVHDLIDYFNQHHLHNQQEIAELENFLLFLDK